jgi:hypothetical protein
MEGLRAGFNKAKPFVLSGVGGLANSFIDLGASAVVAPLWYVDDKIALKVAERFYSQIKQDPTRRLSEIIHEPPPDLLPHLAGRFGFRIG